jgi:hypothetical protein
MFRKKLFYTRDVVEYPVSELERNGGVGRIYVGG